MRIKESPEGRARSQIFSLTKKAGCRGGAAPLSERNLIAYKRSIPDLSQKFDDEWGRRQRFDLRSDDLDPSLNFSGWAGRPHAARCAFMCLISLGFSSARHFEIVMGLVVHPELWAVTKVQAEPERSVCRNASTIVDDLGNAVGEMPIAFAN